MIELTVDTCPDQKDMEFLTRQLLAFNGRQIDGYEYENLVVRANDENGGIMAGIHLQIGGGWAYVNSLWVQKAKRGQGIGRQLMIKGEALARQKGCMGVYLYTYSFQNPGFYEALGYEVFGKLEAFCGDHEKYYMKKRLDR